MHGTETNNIQLNGYSGVAVNNTKMALKNESSSSKHPNPNENLVIPEWINEDYFVPIIAKDVENFVGIKSFTPIAATQPGENYSSVMVRVIVDIEVKGRSENIPLCRNLSNN